MKNHPRQFMITALPAVLLLGLLLAGCASAQPSQPPAQSTAPALTESDVSYAGPMLDRILAGIKDKDYAEFSKDFSPEMKTALNEDGFKQLGDFLQTKIGDYTSKSFFSAGDTVESGKTYTVVIYKAKYTNEPGDVIIQVSFSGAEGARIVEGLIFNSPNLQKQ